MRAKDELIPIAETEVQRVLERLPDSLRQHALELPVTYARKPGKDLVADGVEPDILGLFVGEPHAERGSDPLPLPPQIILYLENLVEYSDFQQDAYRLEVRRTFLHELGHYLGLEEDDLFVRGLD